jgi:hypothetical protein
MLRLLCAFSAHVCAWIATAAFTFTPIFSSISQTRAAPPADGPLVLPSTVKPTEFVFDVQLPTSEITGVLLAYRTRWAENPALFRKRINDVVSQGGHVSYVEGASRELSEPIEPAHLRRGANTISFLRNSFGQAPDIEHPRLLVRVTNRANESTYYVILPQDRDGMPRWRIGAAGGAIQMPDLHDADFQRHEPKEPLEITYPADGAYFGDRALISGRVRTSAGFNRPIIRVAGRAVPHNFGQFETIVDRPAELRAGERWRVPVSVDYANGMSIQRFVELSKVAQSVLDRPTERTLVLDAMQAQAEAFGARLALASPSERVELAVRCNRYLETPAADPGMLNNTSGPCASFEVRRLRGASPITIGIPALLDSLPFGFEPKRSRAFTYDGARQIWLAQADSFVDVENKTTVSTLRDQSAKIVTGVLKLDDNTEIKPQLHDKRTLTDITQVDVLAGHVKMDPPPVSPQGTARTKMPVVLRPMVGDLGPLFELTYDSGGGNGLLGQGWDVDVPMMAVDTKWGVPAFDGAKETETYLFGGRELLAYRKDDQTLADPYLAHRTRPEDRSAFVRPGDLTEFRVRRDEGYERVIRHGASPATYWWEVVRRNGIREVYGADPTTGNIEENAVRRSFNNAIFQWGRTRVVDLDGNMVQLAWEPANCLPATVERLPECRSSLRLNKVTYNDHASVASPPAKTDVTFTWGGGSNAEAPRPDQVVNGRYGVALVTEHALKRLRVTYGGTFFSEQRFRYEKSPFGKSLLSAVIFHVNPETTAGPAISDDELVRHHCGSGEGGLDITRLDREAKNRKVICLRYHNPLSDHPQVAEASQPRQEIAAPAINATRIDGAFDLARHLAESLGSGSVLGTNSSTEIGGSLYLGFAIPADKLLSAGLKTGYLTRNGEGRSSLVDMTGDGIPDLVVAAGDSLRICEGKHSAGASGAVPPPNFNPPAIPPAVTYEAADIGQCKEAQSLDGAGFDPVVMKENGSSFSLGAELFVGPAFVGAAHTASDSSRPLYFADVDGDGLTDIVGNGTVHYNQGKQADGRVGFSRRSRNMIDPSAAAPAAPSGPADELDKLIVAKAKEDAKLRKLAPLMDVVQVWRAPMDGLVAINGRLMTKAVAHPCTPGMESCVKTGDIAGTAKLRIEHSPKDNKGPATFCFHAPLQPGDQAAACKTMTDTDIAEQFAKINAAVDEADRPLLVQVRQGDAIFWRMTSDDRLRFPWVDLDLYVSYLSIAQRPGCRSTDVKPLDCGSRWRAVLAILDEYAALPSGPAKSGFLRERLAACVARWPDGAAPDGAAKKFETHGLVCDELGLSPFFFDLARDSAIAGTLHDDTKLPPGDDVNAVFSGSFEMPNGMGPMSIVLVIDPASPRTDGREIIREIIEPADSRLLQPLPFRQLFQLDVAGKCAGGIFSGVLKPGGTVTCEPDDSRLTVAWKSEPFAPSGGRVRLELRALFDPANVASVATTSIDWSKLIWREQPRVVITPVNATAWPGDRPASGTWTWDRATDLASKKSEFSKLTKLPSVVLLTPHFRNRFLKRIDPDQVGQYRRKQNDGTFFSGIAQGSSGTGTRRGRIKKEREHIQASSTFNYLIEGENKANVSAAEGKRRFDPVIDNNGYLLPGACDPGVGVSCTYEYRLAHVFRTFVDPTIINDLRSAFTFEVEAFVNGRRVPLRWLGEVHNTSKTCPGEGSGNTDEDDLVPATPTNRRIDCVVSGQADPVPAPDPNAARVTGLSFELTDGNEVTGREKVFAFDAKPGDLLHLISTVRPQWNLDTKGYTSCVAPLQCAGPTKPRSVANLLAVDQDDVMKPWRPMMQTEFRLGLKTIRTAADERRRCADLGSAHPPSRAAWTWRGCSPRSTSTRTMSSCRRARCPPTFAAGRVSRHAPWTTTPKASRFPLCCRLRASPSCAPKRRRRTPSRGPTSLRVSRTELPRSLTAQTRLARRGCRRLQPTMTSARPIHSQCVSTTRFRPRPWRRSGARASRPDRRRRCAIQVPGTTQITPICPAPAADLALSFPASSDRTRRSGSPCRGKSATKTFGRQVAIVAPTDLGLIGMRFCRRLRCRGCRRVSRSLRRLS